MRLGHGPSGFAGLKGAINKAWGFRKFGGGDRARRFAFSLLGRRRTAAISHDPRAPVIRVDIRTGFNRE